MVWMLAIHARMNIMTFQEDQTSNALSFAYPIKATEERSPAQSPPRHVAPICLLVPEDRL